MMNGDGGGVKTIVPSPSPFPCPSPCSVSVRVTDVGKKLGQTRPPN